MKIFSALILSTLLLSSCSIPEYGLIAAHSHFPDPSMDRAMADNVFIELDRIFPPAQTVWAFSHPATDPFGIELTQKLRDGGYAVREFSNKALPLSETETPIKYVVDNIGPGLWRVKLFIGNAVLSRPYAEPEKKIGPLRILGPWVKED